MGGGAGRTKKGDLDGDGRTERGNPGSGDGGRVAKRGSRDSGGRLEGLPEGEGCPLETLVSPNDKRDPSKRRWCGEGRVLWIK